MSKNKQSRLNHDIIHLRVEQHIREAKKKKKKKVKPRLNVQKKNNDIMTTEGYIVTQRSDPPIHHLFPSNNSESCLEKNV